MSGSVPYRQQIEALAGGSYIALALQQILDGLNAQPWRIGNATVRSGTGTPELAVIGSVGDLYLRTDGGTSTTLYVKQSGTTTNVGWVAK